MIVLTHGGKPFQGAMKLFYPLLSIIPTTLIVMVTCYIEDTSSTRATKRQASGGKYMLIETYRKDDTGR